MTLTDFVFCILATAYSSHVIVNTAGMANMFIWLRAFDRTGVTKCVWCTAAWVALITVIIVRYGTPFTAHWILETLAVAGGGILVYSYSGARHL